MSSFHYRPLPEEAGPSQYEMKSVTMSTGGFLTPTAGQGKLPDARTPPRPRSPSPPLSTLTSTAGDPIGDVSDYSMKKVDAPIKIGIDGIKPLKPSTSTPKSSGSSKKPKSKDSAKKVKSKDKKEKPKEKPKEKKLTISKSPKLQKKTKSPSKAKSPKGGSKKVPVPEVEKSKEEPKVETPAAPPVTSKVPPAPTTPVKPPSSEIKEFTPIKLKPVKTPAILEVSDDSDSPTASPKLVIAEEEARQREAIEAKRSRIESYSDTIDLVVKMVKEDTAAEPESTPPKPAPPKPSPKSTPKSSQKQSSKSQGESKAKSKDSEVKPGQSLEDEERRLQREADIVDTIDSVIKKAMERKDVYDFSDDNEDMSVKSTPTPSVVKSPAVSEKKKKKDKPKTPKAKNTLKIKVPPKEESDNSEVKEKLKHIIQQKTLSPDWTKSPKEKKAPAEVVEHASPKKQSPPRSTTYNVSMSPVPALSTSVSAAGQQTIQPIRLTIGKTQVNQSLLHLMSIGYLPVVYHINF